MGDFRRQGPGDRLVHSSACRSGATTCHRTRIEPKQRPGQPFYSRPVLQRERGPPNFNQLSMYQLPRSQVLLSQPLRSQTSLSFTAATSGRETTGITTCSFTIISLHLISMPARFTGSSSVVAALKTLSYSLLCQRVLLRPDHLFSFCAMSHETKVRRKISGSAPE